MSLLLRMMIVDDEERARKGIRTLIDWESHGIIVSAEAVDGEQALEYLRESPCDIILTDIRMPIMNGLQLIEQVMKEYSHIRCVIMSGYDEFAYARKAMALGAKDYLLKPSRKQEILDTVLAVVAEIQEERLQSEKIARLKSGFRESLPLLMEKTLGKLVLTDNQPYERLIANLRMNDIRFPHLFFGIIVLQIDNLQALQGDYCNEDIELFKYAMKNIAEETFVLPGVVCAAFEHEDNTVVIMNTGEYVGVAELTPLLERAQSNIKLYLKFTVSAGIGSFNQEIAHLRSSFAEAIKALDARYFVGAGKIVDYMVGVDDDASQTSYPLKEEKAILQAVTGGNGDEALAYLDGFHQALRPDIASKEQVLKSTLALMFALYRFCVEKNLRTDEIFGPDLTKLTRVLAHSSMEYIREALSETVLKINDRLNAKKNGNKLFESVLTYIRNNYEKDISREMVASEVYISPGYLSLLFKQNLKTNFLEHLHQIRMEKACELLRDKGLRISDIAHDVGYKDEKYFFQVFKKYVGVTPNQYRNQ